MSKEIVKSKRLNTKQAAAYVGLAEQSLCNRRHQRLLPNYIKLGRRVLYDTADLDHFLESNRIVLNV